MRRLLIQLILPLVFCLIPVLLALVVVLATPDKARDFYVAHLRKSPIDWVILSLGIGLFAIQISLAWQALQWRGTTFDERPDRWLSNLAQASEWFPMLGLIGTVMGILQTFGTIAASSTSPTAKDIIDLYAPAITATGSGLMMALVNLFPTWIVLLGRDLILSLAGGGSSSQGETRP